MDEIEFEPASPHDPPGVPGHRVNPAEAVGPTGVQGHVGLPGVEGREPTVAEPPSEAPAASEEPAEARIWVRATAHLPGLPLGSQVLVDASDPYMAGALAGGFLARVTADGELVE